MYSSDQVIQHNFIVAIVDLLGVICFTFLSYTIYPLKILKMKIILFFGFMLSLPMLLSISNSPMHILCLQLFICLFAIDSFPGDAVFFSHLPILKRFTQASFFYALSRAIMYIITSFGLIYIVNIFGNYGLWIIFAPLFVGFCYGVYYFDKLEKKSIEPITQISSNKPLASEIT
jgi:hypothetical protein